MPTKCKNCIESFILGVLPILLLLAAEKTWGSDVIDLSVGAASPSVNGAILENPAALTGVQTKMFDISALANNSGGVQEFEASFASTSNSVGYGLGMEQVSGEFGFSGGFAASLGHLSIGVDTSFIVSGSPQFDLGLRYSTQNVTYALVLKNLSNFGQVWTLGLGLSPAKIFRVGFDFNFQSTTPIIGVSNLTVIGIAELYSSFKYCIRVSYGVAIIPTLLADQPPLGVGLDYWFSKGIAGYAIYNDYFQNFTYVIGLKFAI